MFSPCLPGFPPDALVSSNGPKTIVHWRERLSLFALRKPGNLSRLYITSSQKSVVQAPASRDQQWISGIGNDWILVGQCLFSYLFGGHKRKKHMYTVYIFLCQQAFIPAIMLHSLTTYSHNALHHISFALFLHCCGLPDLSQNIITSQDCCLI